jgi:negative regulator of flagellin synthesis FlgM
MKINSGSTPSDSFALNRAGASAGVESAAPAVAGGASAKPLAALQSEVLQPAMAALNAMPEIDSERVAELRDLLAKGELPFDAGRLAGLIQRFHGGK